MTLLGGTRSRHQRVIVTSLALLAALLATSAPSSATPAGTTTDPGERAVQALGMGSYHSCAILSSGDVACWGNNATGQLGMGHQDNWGDDPGEMGDDLPTVDLGAGRTAVAVTAGREHTCAVLDNGSVKCWGGNLFGKLGLGDTDDRGDEPGEMGDNLPTVDLGTGRTATAIASHQGHTCVLLDDSTVKCWGPAFSGQLGYGDGEHRGDQTSDMGDNLPAVDLGTGRTATAIAVSEDTSCAVLDDATLKCWGWGGDGKLGQGNSDSIGDDPDEMGENLPAIDLGTGRTVVALAGGRDHMCAILDDATMKCWGYNFHGQLGIGDDEKRGEDPDEMGDDLPAIDLGDGSVPMAITAGEDYTCVLLADSSVKCWGENTLRLGFGETEDIGDGPGEMGDNLPAIDLGADRMPLAIVSGRDAICTLFDDETIGCWGGNSLGQLGLGDDQDRGDDIADMGDALGLVSLPGRVRPHQVPCPTTPHHGFPDVSGSSYADDHVTCIKELGITNVTHGGTMYSPDDFVTREQMAAFLGRLWRSLDQSCPSSPHHGFPDVPAWSVAEDDITCIKALGITNGTHGGTMYSPSDYVTREQMAAFLGRLWEALGNECPTTPHHGFPDVDPSSYADDHVTCIKELGITNGTHGGTMYSPGDFVTREQMGAFLGRLIDANTAA